MTNSNKYYPPHNPQNPNPKHQTPHGKGAIRHAEKRRKSTCLFADRIAKTSIQAFHRHVPSVWREHNKQVCLATFVVCWKLKNNDEEGGGEEGGIETSSSYSDKTTTANTNIHQNEEQTEFALKVIGLGVGTKFLSETILSEEEEIDTENGGEQQCCDNDVIIDTSLNNRNQKNQIPSSSIPQSKELHYGMRIRDLHAEILARRALRKYLLMEMHTLLDNFKNDNQTTATETKTKTNNNPSSLQQDKKEDNKQQQQRLFVLIYNPTNKKFQLNKHVTIHMYTSSTPCGNSTIKKFAQMSKEKFQSNVHAHQWPIPKHEPIQRHSIHLGQFSLLLKKDSSNNSNSTSQSNSCCSVGCSGNANDIHPPLSKKQKLWPAIQNDQWCPPGTSTVYHGKGRIHTCSDKICRWNCLGVQGSLLASMIDNGHPIYMASLTVGRKFSNCICRRAVCCRATGFDELVQNNDRGRHDGKENSVLVEDGDNTIQVDVTKFKLNHPSIMGTGVYLDEKGGR